MSEFFAKQGVKPKEYFVYFEAELNSARPLDVAVAESRGVAKNSPLRRVRGDFKQALIPALGAAVIDVGHIQNQADATVNIFLRLCLNFQAAFVN